MRSVDDYTRGHSRIIIGFIMILSAFANILFEDYTDYLINGVLFVIGLALFIWGEVVLYKTRGHI